MRVTRKTIVALSVSGALTVMAGVSASAAVLDLPILGFGETASEQSAPPKVVHRTVYDDTYVTTPTTPKPAATNPAASSGTAAASSSPAGGAGPAYTVGATSGAGPAPAPAPAPVAAHVEEPDDSPPVASPGATIPPPPAGCREPEWDSEHRVWQCSSAGEVGDDD